MRLKFELSPSPFVLSVGAQHRSRRILHYFSFKVLNNLASSNALNECFMFPSFDFGPFAKLRTLRSGRTERGEACLQVSDPYLNGVNNDR